MIRRGVAAPHQKGGCGGLGTKKGRRARWPTRPEFRGGGGPGGLRRGLWGSNKGFLGGGEVGAEIGRFVGMSVQMGGSSGGNGSTRRVVWKFRERFLWNIG